MQIRHGPTEDKLKYLGVSWLLLALFVRAQPLGVVGLLVVLAVEVKSEYLLKLFLFLLGPCSFVAGLIYLFTLPNKTFIWVVLELTNLIIQALSVGYAWVWYQEMVGDADAGSYEVPGGNMGNSSAPSRADPFQAYAPPAQPSHPTYQQQQEQPPSQSAVPQAEAREAKGADLL